MLGLPKADLEAFVGSMGSKPFRARQLMNWLYKRGEGDIAAMTDLAKDFRAELVQRAEVAVPEIVKTQIASDGTRKWLLSGGNGQAFEMVYIPEEDRGTLCISSQVGCALDCSFCSTAQQGFNRNLTTAEIVGQVWLANRELGWQVGDNRIITNIVFMGMGEPLANFRNVVPAIRIFLDDLGFDISRRRVTLSTSGLVPQIYKLAEEVNCALAVSLHAPNDELRSQLVPINRKHNIAELFEACWHYLDEQNGRSVTFEYVMLDGINDQPAHARELAKLLRDKPAKLNLIPFNPFPGTQLSPLTRAGDREIPRRAHAARAHRHHPQDARRRHRCGLRTTRGPGHRPHHRAAGFENLRLAGARMNTRWIAGLAVCLLAGCVSTDGTKPRKQEDPTEAAAKTNIQLGVAYLQQGNYPLAKEKLERSLKQNPKDPDVHTSLALLYDRVREPKLADKHFREALRLAPDNPDISNNYAIYLCKNGRVDEGVERFSTVATNKYYRTPEVALIERRRVPARRQAVRRGASRCSPAPSRCGLTTARPRCSSRPCTSSAASWSRRARWSIPISARSVPIPTCCAPR